MNIGEDAKMLHWSHLLMEVAVSKFERQTRIVEYQILN